MSFSGFKAAKREGVQLLIGVAGGTGSGKTMSAMRIATGIVGRDKPFAVIDTEKGRAKHYAPVPGQEPNFTETFRFDHAELNAPFRPDAYSEAIVAADKAGYGVIVVDSASLVWSGDGGVLDWREEIMEEAVRRAAARNDNRPEWQIREGQNMASWIEPKMAHKRMVQKLLQVRAHVILCFRAEEKIEMVKEGGKTKIVPKQGPTGTLGWMPIAEKTLPFELTCSFLLTPDAPGVPKPIKLQEQHKAFFPLDKRIGEAAGQRIALWSRGGSPGDVAPAKARAEQAPAATDAPAPPKTSPAPAPEASSDPGVDSWLKDNE